MAPSRSRLIAVACGMLLTASGLAGCETANTAARDTGVVAGKILKVPASANAGISRGLRDPDGPNPYNR